MERSRIDITQALREVRSGSRQALGDVLVHYQRYLLWIARREIDPSFQPKGGASDVVQETMLDAQRDFGQFLGTSDVALMSWLRQLLRHNLANFRRHYRGTSKRQIAREVSFDGTSARTGGETPFADKGPSPERQAIHNEDGRILEELLGRLPDHYRQVMTLWYEEGRSFQEIGVTLGTSANAIRSVWYRAIKLLQAEAEAAP